VIHGGEIHGGEIHGGEIHGGVMWSGEIHGGVMWSGEIRGGVIYGGEIRGGVIYGGEIHGGVMRGGVIYDGVIYDGVIHGGVIYDDNHIGFANVGSERGYLLAYIDDNKIMISRGCFHGTIAEFYDAVEKTHSGNEHDEFYRLIRPVIETKLNKFIESDSTCHTTA